MPRTGPESGIKSLPGDALVNIGFGNYVLASRVIGIINPASSPMKRLREDARLAGKLIDATQGRKTRSLLVMDSSHIILSAIQAETISQRFTQENGRCERE